MTLFRSTAAALALAITTTVGAAAQSPTHITVMKTETCGCCTAWVEHLEEFGFVVETRNMSHGALNHFKDKRGIANAHKSCHTGIVDGYVIEGHVPAPDIATLLDTAPDALGLSVPRMPIGSPGMEMGTERDAYDVLLLGRNGQADVFNSYDAQSE